MLYHDKLAPIVMLSREGPLDPQDRCIAVVQFWQTLQVIVVPIDAARRKVATQGLQVSGADLLVLGPSRCEGAEAVAVDALLAGLFLARHELKFNGAVMQGLVEVVDGAFPPRAAEGREEESLRCWVVVRVAVDAVLPQTR